MDESRGLITTLCDEGQLNKVTRAGITSSYLDDDSSLVLTFIQRHFSDYKQVPSREAVKRSFPNYEFATYKEPLEYFIDAIKESYRRTVLEDKFEQISSVYQSDTTRAESLLRETLSDLQVTSKSFKDVNIAETAKDRIQQYKDRKGTPPEDGILSGWGKMDFHTLGFHKEEFVVLAGKKYIGKSWIMIWLAYQALLQKENVLFVTKEMSTEAITRRLDSIYASVNFTSLRRGELSEVEEKRYFEKMEELADSKFHFTVAREGVSTIEDIESKAIETDASIVFGDSIYLFLPDNKTSYAGEVNKRLEISRKCKEVSRNLEIPFVASVQAGRKTKDGEPDLDDIEWSNAFSQDADTVFFCEKTDIDKDLNRIQIHGLKSRDGDTFKFPINTDFNYMQFAQCDDDLEPTTTIEIDDEEDVIDYGNSSSD